MRHFYIKAKVEQSLGRMRTGRRSTLRCSRLQIAPYKHQRLAALRIAGELKSGPADGATLDELLERIKHQLTKLGPILEVEVVREPEGSRTEGSVALAN